MCVSICFSECMNVPLCLYVYSVFLCHACSLGVCVCMDMCAYMLVLYGTNRCTVLQGGLAQLFLGILPFANFFYFRPVVHNIWVMTPTGVTYQMPFISNILHIRYLHCNL